MPLLNGAHVRTLENSGPGDYEFGARKYCQWHVPGVVIRHSDSHGLCYFVRHLDGTYAWYEPNELVENWMEHPKQ